MTGEVLLAAALLLLPWWIVFGGFGGWLCRARAGSSWPGVLAGIGLGPVGWLLIWWRTRSRRTTADGETAWAAEAWPDE